MKLKEKQTYINDLEVKLIKLQTEIDKLKEVYSEYTSGRKYIDPENGGVCLESFAKSLTHFLLSDTTKYNVKPLGALNSGRFIEYFYRQKANRILDEIEFKDCKVKRLQRDIENNKKKLEKLSK